MRLGASTCHRTPSLVGVILALLAALLPLAHAATVTFDGGPTGDGTVLDTPANWTGDALPVTGSEVLFNTSITLPSVLSTSTTTSVWGDLIWNSNVTSAITIDSTNGTNRNLQLSGAAGSSEAILQGGAAGDLILLGSEALNNTLIIGGNAGGGAGRLNMALLASGNFNVVNSGATLNILSLISGAFNLSKTGAGTLTLSGANSFGSAATSFSLNAGTVNINSTTALGASSNTFVINGGTFDNTSGAAITTSSYKQTWNSSFTFTGTNNLTLGSGTVSLGTAAGTSRTVTVTAGTLGLSGVISNGTTASSVVKEGAGTLLLGGASTFTGGFVVKNGTALASASAAFGAAAGTITLGDTSGSKSASLLGSGVNSITIASPIVVASGSSGNTLTIGTISTGTANTTFNNTISLGHDLTITAGAALNLTSLSGVISETGGARALTVNAGDGTISITGANTFTGGVTLNNGRLIVANGSTGTGPMTITGGLLDTTSTSASTAATLNNSSYLWNGDFTVVGTTGITLSGGGVVLGGNRVVTTNVINSPLLTVSGGIGDAGNGYSLTKAGGGTLNLNGASTYTGATIMTRGTLNLIQAGSSLAGTSSVTVTGGTLNLGVASGTGVANRINAAASLSLGGSGVFTLNAGAAGPVNSQAFTSLSVLAGSSQISTTSTTNAGTFTFTGPAASVYSRSIGGVLRIVVGTNTTFTNAPTGGGTIGTGTSAMLIGAVTGTTATVTSMTDFVRASAGVVSAPVYGTNVWAAGVNTTITAPLDVSGTGVTQSLRFNANGNYGVTLGGTSTIESGGILVTSAAVGGGTITGGQIQAASGGDLWAYVSTLAASPQGLKISSLIADNGSSSLTKGGAGVLYLTNPGNTYAGGTFLGEGTLNIVSGGTLGAGPLNFTGTATLQAGATSVNLGTRAVTIATGQVAIFNAASGTTLTVPGVISGEGGLTKNGAGTLVLSAANTYTGPTGIENGTLKLDFTAADAPVSNIIPADSLFNPGGGSFLTVGAFSQTLLIQGKDATANSQTFGGVYTNLLGYDTPGLYLNRGMTHINLVAGGSGGTLTVDVGAISRGYSTDVGASVDFSIGAGVTVLASSIGVSNFATVNGETWATVSGGVLTGMPTASYGTSYAGAGAVLDVGTGGTLSANPSSIRFNNSAAATVAPGANVVRIFQTGGILVTPNVGAATSTISAGFIAGYGARDLIIHQNNTAGALQIDASLVDSGGRTQTLTKNGQGTVVFTAPNGYTAASYINEGTVVAAGDATASFTRTATATAGNAVLTMSNTDGIVLGQSVTEATALTTSSTTWTVVAINPGVSVTLSSNASASLSGGTFAFGAMGALGGGSSSTHYIAPGATLQLGNGGTTGSMLNGQNVANNGTFIINRSNDLTFGSIISGTGSFEKQGAGNVTLSASGTFTGDTRIAGGTLTLSAVATNLQSSTLDYNSYGGTLSFGTLAAVTLGGLEGGQNLVLTNAATTPAAVALTVGGNNQDTTYTGSLSGLGSLTKLGGGVLTLGGTSNTYTGITSMTQGTLNLAGTFTAIGNITTSGGLLNLSGTFVDLGTLAVAGGVANLSGSYTRTLAYSSGAGLTVTGGVLNVSGTLGTSAAVPVGQTAFSGNSVSNFSGTVFLSGSSSTFRVGEASSATVNVTGGTLTIGTSSGGVVLGRTNAAASGFLNVSGGSFVVTGGSSIRVGAGFTDSESSGASVVTISGTGTFDTGTTSGLFLFGSNLAGNSASTGTLNLDGGTLSTNRSISGGTVGASIVNLNGGTFKATGSAATLATSVTTVNVRDGGAVINTNGFDIAIAEPLVHSTVVGDNATDGGLTKQGAGILVLSGVSTYTGATTVSAGTLQVGVAGAGRTGTGATSLNGSGAVLSGTGMVQGTTSVILGQIRPGDTGGAGEGTLSFSNGLSFTQAASSTAAALTIQGTTTANETGDRISITGALTLDADSIFTISSGASWTPTENQSWTLMDWSGLLSLNGWSTGTNFRTGSNTAGDEGNLDLPDLSGYGLNWNISTLLDGTTGGSLTLTIVNLVPEPSRALLTLMGTACVLLRRHRRSAYVVHT